jgi:hypothetical protein
MTEQEKLLRLNETGVDLWLLKCQTSEQTSIQTGAPAAGTSA